MLNHSWKKNKNVIKKLHKFFNVRVRLNLIEDDGLKLEEIVRSMDRDKVKRKKSSSNASRFGEVKEM